MKTLRFGILSTASVNAYSFLPYKDKVQGMELWAIASRDMSNAENYAARHGIPKAFGTYESMIADPRIDCVYIPLPVSMHAEWTIKALEGGKHVLCEKPVAANETQARRIGAAAQKTGKIFAQAFHYRYHPLAGKIEELVRSGDIGKVTKIFAQFGVPLTDKSKVQFKPELGGGALLDIGCYPVSFARWIADCDEAEVMKARAKITPSGVDGAMSATLKFGNGVMAEITGSLVSFIPPCAVIHGTKGSIFVLSPFSPSVPLGPVTLDLYLLILRRGIWVQSIRAPGRTSYHCQIEEFCEAVRTGFEPKTGADDAVADMRLIDAIYAKAGVERMKFE